MPRIAAKYTYDVKHMSDKYFMSDTEVTQRQKLASCRHDFQMSPTAMTDH